LTWETEEFTEPLRIKTNRITERFDLEINFRGKKVNIFESLKTDRKVLAHLARVSQQTDK